MNLIRLIPAAGSGDASARIHFNLLRCHFASADELEEIVVTASLRAQDIRQIPASVWVQDSPTPQATTLEPVVLEFESHDRVKTVRVYAASRGTNGGHVVTSHTTHAA